jgi:hypothetical protein
MIILCKDLIARAAKSITRELGKKHTASLELVAKSAGYDDYAQALNANFAVKNVEELRNSLRSHGLSWKLIYSICPTYYEDEYRIPVEEDFVRAEWTRPEISSGDVIRFFYRFYGDMADFKIRETVPDRIEEYRSTIVKVRAQLCMECFVTIDSRGSHWAQAMLYLPEDKKYIYVYRDGGKISDLWDLVDDDATEDHYLVHTNMRCAWGLPRDEAAQALK